MKYPLETLGHERFQELCQALLTKSFPATQCFPLNQADGGRDAIVPSGADNFLVFQVKYSTGKGSDPPPRTWLLDTLQEEAPKLEKLLPRGASEFILLTNAYASGALDTGSHDRVSDILRDQVPVPAACWWRDDLERRLDDAWDIKWAFPEILSNFDIIRLILEHQSHSSAPNRAAALKTALRDQFDQEKDVRFKQVDLRNDLLDLFVDVPLAVPDLPQPRDPRHSQLAALHDIARQQPEPTGHEGVAPGAATMLLHEGCQRHVPRLVLEGAPGQGKSTIVQYVCQIHRHHLLNESLPPQKVPRHHGTQPIRLPFKIDCRDFDTWMHGGSPFPDTTQPEPSRGTRSLETFLCAQIEHHSGGAHFGVDDLHAVLRLSPVLLAFDGLDEVADIDRRRLLVDSISKGVSRLEEVSLSVQTLVTSRPAAFANSPSLPHSKYLYLSLTSIGRPTIDEYTNRWLRARHLPPREADDVRAILSEKLDEPHLADLARNPMQLAILLSLIHTRGLSLPDKRTALYDSYVDLFFAREAEKSVVVRENRDLLVNIHRYLAWILHSEAQTSATRGSVSEARLRRLVQRYLQHHGHDPDLASKLFSGITDRVVALVSRIQGTFEFEVQPLREYFAARHLYNTAPYSPPGAEKSGTLPDRFEALSRDFFWQNVTRFYAGCYSAGELPSLVESLRALSADSAFSLTGYPQELAAALLSDWTFAQYPRQMETVVPLVVDGPHPTQPSSGARVEIATKSLSLPWQCGGEEMVTRSLESLSARQPQDHAQMLLDHVQESGNPAAVFEKWRGHMTNLEGEDLTRWLSYGLTLGVLNQLSNSEVRRLLTPDSPASGTRVLLLEQGGALRPKMSASQLANATHELLHAPDDGTLPSATTKDDFGRFRHALTPKVFELLLNFGGHGSLFDFWETGFSRFQSSPSEREATSFPETPLAEACRLYTAAVEDAAARFSLHEWRTRIGPWSSVVEFGRQQFGDAWVFRVFALLASATKSGRRVSGAAEDLFDDNAPLCMRAKYARLRAGSSAWWNRTLRSAPDWERRSFALLLFCSWAGPKTLGKAGGIASELIGALPDEWWSRLHSEFSRPIRYWSHYASKASRISLEDLPAGTGVRLLALLSPRLDRRSSKEMHERFLRDYDGNDPAVLNLRLETAFRCVVTGRGSWAEWLDTISTTYRKGGSFHTYFMPGPTWQRPDPFGLDLRHARRILEESGKYPLVLVALAEQVCRSAAARDVVPVGRVAERDEWFQVEST